MNTPRRSSPPALRSSDEHRRGDPEKLRRLLPYAIEVAAVVAVFGAVGAGCGWLWFQIWHQPVGTVYRHDWYPDEEALRNVFDGVALYVVLAAVGGLLVGAAATLLARRSPPVTLAAVLLGSALAAWLMLQVGLHLSPTDPEVLARTAANGDELGGRLSLEGARSAYLAWPLASLVVLMVLNFLLSSRDEIRSREADDPLWLSRKPPGDRNHPR